MTIDKKFKEYGENKKFTSGDLQTILEVNKKAIEIHLETVKQYEDIIEELESIKEKSENIDKAVFQIKVILGSIGVSTIIALIALFLPK